MSYIHFNSIPKCFAVALAAIATGCADRVPDAAANANEQPIAQLADVHEVDERLANAVPDWDPAELERPASARWSLRTETALQLAAGLQSEALSFDRRLDNGRMFYTDPKRSVGLQIDAERGFFKLARHMPEDKSAASDQASATSALQGAEPAQGDATAFESDQAKAALMDLARQLGVPAIELATPFDSDFAQSSDGKKVDVFARHVRVERIINGVKVDGSRVMATFTLAGTPFRAECDWHPFVLAEGKVRQRDRVLEELNDLLSPELEDPTKVVEAELRYVLLPTGDFEPVLAVWFFTADMAQAPELRRYSLTRGLLPEDVGAEPGVDR